MVHHGGCIIGNNVAEAQHWNVQMHFFCAAGEAMGEFLLQLRVE
jgi:hypothetical protein